MGAWIGPYNPSFEIVSALRRRLQQSAFRVSASERKVANLMSGSKNDLMVFADAQALIFQQTRAWRVVGNRLEWL